jgi:hypothetical protein
MEKNPENIVAPYTVMTIGSNIVHLIDFGKISERLPIQEYTRYGMW